MTLPPDAMVVRAFLRRAATRVTLLLMMHGFTTGLMAVLVISVALWLRNGSFGASDPVWLVLPAVGIIVGAVRGRFLRSQAAAIIESKAPECRNLLITASELIDGTNRADSYVADLVYRNTASLVESLRLGTLLPFRGAVISTTVALLLYIVVATRHPTARASTAARNDVTTPVAAIAGIDATIRAPAYTGRQATTLHDPARIVALTGSTIQLSVRANGSAVSIETLRGRQSLRQTAAGTFEGSIVANADGYLAVEASTGDGLAAPRRLIGLSVTPDEAPQVHITTPGHDLKFAEGHHTIDISVDATSSFLREKESALLA